ncbi:Hpt domain-containing protein [Pseudanabaena mucicola]|uniref:Hpt domain-containing protein n=1 Tax=Pseudanabaena mucicola FACHB-723 TaxID=2692860 RepID=A0ABR7ZRN8_9CYAN|nr:Hpt domain-containing protein [Pseudanabaena mucicola]MBD2186618.1 Hpt domain-containing protein [Pseudanabaena mucicola FACHB-723]
MLQPSESSKNNEIANSDELLNAYPEFAGLPVLDDLTFQELRETIGDDLIFSDLVTVYLSSAEGLLESIKDALSNQDYQKLFLSAHSLKSTSASIGALRLASISRYLEMLGKAEDTQNLPKIVDLIVSEYPKMTAALQALVIGLMSE